jgi:stage II sporulation protein D
MGRGFGHGVGLCQEGAMHMAQLGYTYEDIIHFYYADVHLIPRHMLWFFKE